MNHRLFLIALGALTLISFSTSSLAAGVEESTENGLSPRTVKTEESQEPQKVFPLLSLDRHLFQRVGGFLSSHDLLQLAQVSKYCLSTVASHFSIELSLGHENLTEEEFLRYFNQENGMYKEAQCLNLSGSSFHPAWLRHLPRTLRSLKLRRLQTNSFSEYGFENELAMKMENLRVLVNTLPNLKSLDISQNWIGEKEARLIAENLTALTSLNLAFNKIGTEGTRHIAKNLRALTSLNIFGNGIGVEGARLIAEDLTALTSLNISSNQIGAVGSRLIAENLNSLTSLSILGNEIGTEGAHLIAKNLKYLTYLDISGNGIGVEGARLIAENLKSLTSLDISENRIGDEGARLIAENLTALTLLGISRNQIGEEGARALVQLPALNELYLGHNPIKFEVGLELRPYYISFS